MSYNHEDQNIKCETAYFESNFELKIPKNDFIQNEVVKFMESLKVHYERMKTFSQSSGQDTQHVLHCPALLKSSMEMMKKKDKLIISGEIQDTNPEYSVDNVGKMACVEHASEIPYLLVSFSFTKEETRNQQ